MTRAGVWISNPLELLAIAVAVFSLVIGVSWSHLRDLYRKHRIDL